MKMLLYNNKDALSPHNQVQIHNTDNAALFNTVEAAFCFLLTMLPNEQHKQCAPEGPVIAANKFSTWMCCCTYGYQIHQPLLALFCSHAFCLTS